MVIKNFGYIFSVKDSIAQVLGLSDVTSGEMVSNNEGNLGLVLNLERYWTGVVMFEDNVVMSGDKLFRLYKSLSISSDPFLLGNVFDPTGNLLNVENVVSDVPLTNFSLLFGDIIRDVEVSAPSIIVRQPVYETLFTGYIGVDAVLPLGQGQRELIIGDRQTGKTAIALDAILSQANVEVTFDKFMV